MSLAKLKNGYDLSWMDTFHYMNLLARVYNSKKQILLKEIKEKNLNVNEVIIILLAQFKSFANGNPKNIRDFANVLLSSIEIENGKTLLTYPFQGYEVTEISDRNDIILRIKRLKEEPFNELIKFAENDKYCSGNLALHELKLIDRNGRIKPVVWAIAREAFERQQAEKIPAGCLSAPQITNFQTFNHTI